MRFIVVKGKWLCLLGNPNPCCREFALATLALLIDDDLSALLFTLSKVVRQSVTHLIG